MCLKSFVLSDYVLKIDFGPIFMNINHFGFLVFLWFKNTKSDLLNAASFKDLTSIFTQNRVEPPPQKKKMPFFFWGGGSLVIPDSSKMMIMEKKNFWENKSIFWPAKIFFLSFWVARPDIGRFEISRFPKNCHF